MHGTPMQTGQPNGVRSSDWLGFIVSVSEDLQLLVHFLECRPSCKLSAGGRFCRRNSGEYMIFLG